MKKLTTLIQLVFNHITILSYDVQDTLCHSKGIGTLTKKTKAPQITEEDKIRAAIEVKKNTIKASVSDLWRRLQVITKSICFM